jgi:hypothetical protein
MPDAVARLLFAIAVSLVPGALGGWLIRGHRWVRWLFALLVFAAWLATLAQLLCPGFGPDADEASCSGTAWLAITVVMSVAVFIHTGKSARRLE